MTSMDTNRRPSLALATGHSFSSDSSVSFPPKHGRSFTGATILEERRGARLAACRSALRRHSPFAKGPTHYVSIQDGNPIRRRHAREECRTAGPNGYRICGKRRLVRATFGIEPSDPQGQSTRTPFLSNHRLSEEGTNPEAEPALTSAGIRFGLLSRRCSVPQIAAAGRATLGRRPGTP
jgi:hypothetical protein